MSIQLLDEEVEEKGIRLIEEPAETQEPVPEKGIRLLPDELETPKGIQLIEEPGLFEKAYQNTLKPVLDYFGENEVESKVLIPIEGVEKPKPTDDNRIATIQLLQQVSPLAREEALSEISKLIDEGKLFSEEAVKRLPIDPEYSRKVLLTGLQEPKQFKRDISFQQAIKEGYQESAIGMLTGRGIQEYETLLQRAESEIPFLKRQAKNLSKIIGDLPAFIAGGAVASLPAGGPETPVGAVLAGSGALATQTLLESSYKEALRLVNEHPELKGKTLEQLVTLVTDPQALKEIGLATVESGALGALVALNPLMKALEKTPLSKLLKVPIGRKAAELATEVTTLTTVPAAIRGKIPSAEDFLDNAILIGGLKVSASAAQKLAEWAKKGRVKSEEVISKLGEKFTKDDEQRLADAATPEEVDAILNEVQNREVMEKPEPEKPPEVVEPEEKAKEAEQEPKQPAAEQPEAIDKLESREEAKEPTEWTESELNKFRKDLEVQKERFETKRRALIKEANEKAKGKSKKEKQKIAREYKEKIDDMAAYSKEAESRIIQIDEAFRKGPTNGKFTLPPFKRIRRGLVQPEQKYREISPKGTETNVPKKTDIMRLFKDAFKDTPFRLGKFPRRLKKKAFGFYDLGKNVIRLQEAGMIETAAHELGHKLHMALFGGEGDLKKQLVNIRKALMPYMEELNPISRYAPHDLEGFAEFTRMYVTNPKAAEELAPSFYKFFESEMTKKAPDVLEALKQAREMYERFLNSDPVARTYAHIQSGLDQTLWEKSGDWFSKTFNVDNLKRGFLDEYFPIKRAVADTLGIAPVQVENWKSPLNAYTAARVLKGWVGKGEVFLLHETFNARTLKANGKGLKEILAPIKTIGERQELSAYLVAKRAELLKERKIKSGLDDRAIYETIKRLEEKYDGIAEELNDYQNRLLEYYRDSGMISADTFNKIKAFNKFYVPFYRFFEEGEKRIGQRTGGETGKLQPSQTIKRIFGSTREIIDPLESIIKNTFSFIQSAEKNIFGQTLAKLTLINPRGGKFMEAVPPQMRKVYEVQKEQIIAAMLAEAKKKDLKLSEVGGDEALVKMAAEVLPDSIQKWTAEGYGPAENVVTIYFNGKPKYYETTPEIADLYKNSGSQLESNIIVKILNVPAKMLRAGAILNPRFIQKNAVRDLLGGVLYTKHTDVPILNEVYAPFRGLMSSINKDALYVDWLKAGGGMSTMQSIDKNVTTVKKGLGKGLEKVRPIALLRRVAEVSEEMNRLAEYSKAVEAMGDSRWQKEMAAFQSRDISIDFAKYGAWTKALNQIIPFWNATIQGGDKLVRTLASKDPKVIQDFFTRVSAGIVMPTLLLEVANTGDKDIEEIDEVTKDTNFIFRDPLSGEIIQIPVPFETGVLFHGLTRRLYNFAVEKDPQAFDGFFGSIQQAATPGFIPIAAQPFFEVWANKDFFRNRHIVHPSKIGLITEEQYGTFTSQTARLIGRALSYLPGVDEYTSNITSPDIVEHFIRSWGGGLGTLALKFSDEALRAVNIQPSIAKPEESLLDRFGLNAFTKKFPTARTKSIDEFYETYERWKRLDRSAEAKLEKGDVEGAKKLKAEQKKVSAIDMKPLVKTMQKNQALINNVFENPKMTSKEKSIIIEKLYRQQIEMSRAYMNSIKRNRD